MNIIVRGYFRFPRNTKMVDFEYHISGRHNRIEHDIR